MDLSIIIVNWNSKDYLRECIDSILRSTHGINFEIVVIDGGSFDGCDEMLRQYYPKVIFTQSADNLGFARANNEAFKISKGRNVLFLNPDTEIEGDAICDLFCHLDSLPNAGIIGGKILNSDGSIQNSCVRSFPTILNQLLDAEFLKDRFPLLPLWGMAPLYQGISGPVEVDAVSGACLMSKRHIFESINKFSTDYFMYSEDIDLCYKVSKSGYKIYYLPKATIIHHGGGSSSKSKLSTFSIVMMMESRFRYFQKTQSRKYAALFRMTTLIAAIIRIIIVTALIPFLMVRGKASFIRGPLVKWISVMRWAIGFEKWAMKY